MNAPIDDRGSGYPGKHASRKAGRGLGSLASALLRGRIARFDRGIVAGSLEALLPDGTMRTLGGQRPGPIAMVHIRSWRAVLRLAVGGSSGWYEAWRLGEWTSTDPVQLFALFSRNRATLGRSGRATGLPRLVMRFAHWLRRNDRSGSKRNIAFHYDLGNDFYAAWLDPGMTYSSAIFESAQQSLEKAQSVKLAAILERTGTKPGDRILEIGCGWGSFAEMAARAGRAVDGITLSAEQKAYADARMETQGLNEVRISLTDYRDVTDTYDAVASIEMVEAVGRQYWPDYLAAVSRALKPGGRAAIQYISFDAALFEDYAGNVDFIQAHVFPGGLLISEREFAALARSEGLEMRDRNAFGLCYAETLRQWRVNFDAAVAAGAIPAHFDAEFVALWRYYLMYCEGGFLGGGIDVTQVTLVKS